MSEKSLKWTCFGWQGITGDVPQDWALGAVDGDWQSGYFRIDDEKVARLEARWTQTKGGFSADRVVKKYLRVVKRDMKKSSRTARISCPCPAIDRLGVFEGRKGVSFSWDGDSHVRGAIWRCESCNRIVFLQLGLKSNNGQEVASKILRSLKDHPSAGTSLWSVYGLRCHIPSGYQLTSCSLTVGFLQLCFASREFPKRQLEISRWGPARFLLKGRELAEWWTGYLLSRDEGPTSSAKDGEMHSHVCMTASGELKGGFSPQAKGRVLKLRRLFSIKWCGKAWHCPQSDRVYAVRSTDHPRAFDLVNELAEGGVCHEV